MPLFVVATPIGNPQDLSPRAVDVLKRADLVIGEEMKVLRQILKAAGVQARATDQLNEHSRPADLDHFVTEAKTKIVALVSDCGTPGFCDPGADLVHACYQTGVAVHTVPGPSSLMALLSVCGTRVDRFTFLSFLPAKTEAREKALADLTKERHPVIFLETPYRAAKLVEDLARVLPERLCILGLNLSQDDERVIRAKGKDLPKHGPFADVEPVVMVLPSSWKL